MSQTTTRQEEAAPAAQPREYITGIPRYRAGEAPAHLLSETALRARRLRLSEGQQPRAYTTSRYVPRVRLYDPAEAAPMRPLSPKQQVAWEARRTCGECGTMQDAPIGRAGVAWPGMPSHLLCGECRLRLYQQWAHTCPDCRTEFRDTWCQGEPCRACRERWARAEEVMRRMLLRHCPECWTPTATRAEVEAAQAADPHSQMHGYSYAAGFPRTCQPCVEALRQAAEEVRRQGERNRWDELGPVRRWAREVLADPEGFAVIDTETTGLDSDAKVVEIGATTGSGRVLLDTLVHPGVPIPVEASSVHGIHDQDVHDAPRFGEVLPRLTEALRGRRVIIYNRSYDTGVLAYELDRHHRVHAPPLDGIEQPTHEKHPAAAAWMEAQQWDRCAMEAYAVHVGEWNEYFGDWAWPPLRGGHRAVGDCLAVVDRIREIAETPDP
ncbi:3'-5' exonuclease [Streptomyces sp. NPDC047525]|uniref:3'-5' exonuclease n=1 Tax=Streptomyces sp. NPDC047525 TaxID=3155264 RepID=UPI0033FBE630